MESELDRKKGKECVESPPGSENHIEGRIDVFCSLEGQVEIKPDDQHYPCDQYQTEILHQGPEETFGTNQVGLEDALQAPILAQTVQEAFLLITAFYTTGVVSLRGLSRLPEKVKRLAMAVISLALIPGALHKALEDRGSSPEQVQEQEEIHFGPGSMASSKSWHSRGFQRVLRFAIKCQFELVAERRRRGHQGSTTKREFYRNFFNVDPPLLRPTIGKRNNPLWILFHPDSRSMDEWFRSATGYPFTRTRTPAFLNSMVQFLTGNLEFFYTRLAIEPKIATLLGQVRDGLPLDLTNNPLESIPLTEEQIEVLTARIENPVTRKPHAPLPLSVVRICKDGINNSIYKETADNFSFP